MVVVEKVERQGHCSKKEMTVRISVGDGRFLLVEATEPAVIVVEMMTRQGGVNVDQRRR